MELREVFGKRAIDEHRLLELIEEVPADSSYYHTHSSFLRHAYGATWMWRCHIDVSIPQHSVWQCLRPLVVRYDAAVFSLSKFSQRLPLPQFLVYPSIDPFSEKNCELEPDEIDDFIHRRRT